MKNIIVLILFFVCFKLVSQPAPTQSQEWVVNTSTIKFKIKNAGISVDGTFSGLKAKIFFNATNVNGNSIDATVETKTLNSGIKSRDGHLRKAEYFDAVVFPTVRLNANSFVKEPNGSFKGYFKLTLKGKTKDVVIPFTFSEMDGKASMKGSFTINRLDFGVGESSMFMSDNATITIEINAIKK